MNFLLGLFIGAAIFSSDGRAPPHQDLLSQIPFRCFSAFDDGDAAYLACRRLSMMKQLQSESRVFGPDGTGTCWAIWKLREKYDLYEFLVEPSRQGCDVDRALTLELRTLRALEAAAAARPGAQR